MMIEKGVYILLEACKILKLRGNNFECHLIGKWSDIQHSDFTSWVNINSIEKYVFAHGPKYNSEKEKFLNNADAFVFPTFYHGECFPLVLLEALSWGLPCITTNEGAIESIIINNVTGLIAQKKDPIDLANKMEQLMLDPELYNKLQTIGKKQFSELYTLKKFENKFTNILEDCLINEK